MSGRPLPWGSYTSRSPQTKHPPWVPPPASSSPTRSRGSTPPARLSRASSKKRSGSKKKSSKANGSRISNQTNSVYSDAYRNREFDDTLSTTRGRAQERYGHQYHHSYQNTSSMVSPDFESKFRQGMESALARTRSIPGGGIEMMSRSISPLRSTGGSSVHTPRERSPVGNDIDDYQVKESDLERELVHINSALKSHRERGPRSEHSAMTTPVGGGGGALDGLSMASPPDFRMPQDVGTPKVNSLGEKIKQKAAEKGIGRPPPKDSKSAASNAIAAILDEHDDQDAPNLSELSADWKGLVSDMIIKLHNNNELIDTLHQCDGNPDHNVPHSTTSTALLKVLGYKGNHYHAAPQRCDARRCLVAELSNTLL